MRLRRVRLFAGFAMVSAVAATVGGSPASARVEAFPHSDGMLITQIYAGGGGSQSATYKKDYVVLMNAGTTSVDLTSDVLDMTDGTGNDYQDISTMGAETVPPGGHVLVDLGYANGGSAPGGALPTADQQDTAALNHLLGSVELLYENDGGNSTQCTTNASNANYPDLIDLVGWSTGNGFCSEGTTAPAMDNGIDLGTQALVRKGNGCQQTGNDGSDFVLGAPDPLNSASPNTPCDKPPVFPTTPGQVVTVGHHLAFSVAATDPEGDTVTYNVFGLPAGATVSHKGRFSWTPRPAEAGKHVVTISAMAGSLSTTEKVSINVLKSFTVTRVTHTAKGAASAHVKVPSRGTLTLSGTGLTHVTYHARRAASAILTTHATGASLRRLKRRGHLRLEATIRFAPAGGSAYTKRQKVVLVDHAH